MRAIVKNGLRGLTRDRASVDRELVYGTIRIGGYESIRNLVAAAAGGGAQGGEDNEHLAFREVWKRFAGGAIGSAIANPFDLVKTRFRRS